MKQNYFDINFLAASDNQLLDVYSTTVSGVVKSAAQGVVHIKVMKKMLHPQTQKMIELPAAGSGFAISSDGYIVTNNHVIEDASSIKAAFEWRRPY